MECFYANLFDCLEQYEKVNIDFCLNELFFRVTDGHELTDFENESNQLNIATMSTCEYVGEWLNFLLQQIHDQKNIRLTLKELYDIDDNSDISPEEVLTNMEDKFMFHIDIKSISHILETKRGSRTVKKRLTAVAIWDLKKIRDEFMSYYLDIPTDSLMSRGPVGMPGMPPIPGMPDMSPMPGMPGMPQDKHDEILADIFDKDNDLFIVTTEKFPPFIFTMPDDNMVIQGVKGQDGKIRDCTSAEMSIAKEYGLMLQDNQD